LKKLFIHAVGMGYISRSPVTNLKLDIGKEPQKKRALTDEEIEIILSTARRKHPNLYDLFVFLLNTGVRIGEAIALTWEDISDDYSLCCINKTLTRYKDNSSGKYVSENSTPKNKTSDRTILLNDTLKRLLKDIKNWQTNAMHESWNENNRIFLNKRMDGWKLTSVEQSINLFQKELKKEHGEKFPAITAHYFRHTFASRAIESNIPMLYLQKIGGWSNMDMISKVYGHMSNEQARDAINSIPPIE
ncbi:MAG: tyrosine-type recombinase/integrase, partial [Candidatus Ornithomonoglobus sp.]